jgi:hypothetical protein
MMDEAKLNQFMGKLVNDMGDQCRCPRRENHL